MKSSVWVILGIALSSYFAHSQINSGSIVVFNVSQDKAVMAADSRGVRSDGGPPNDAKCKIITCGGSGMFAATNVAGYVRGSDRRDFAWDSYDEATKVCDSIKGHSFSDASAEVNAMADQWGANMAAIWERFRLFHGNDFVKSFRGEEGGLTNGVFIVAAKGHLAVAGRKITFDESSIGTRTIDTPTGESLWSAFGRDDIFDEFVLSLSSPRSKAAMAERLKRPDSSSQIARAIHIVDLTITYTSGSDVGGPIDAVELTSSGQITWKQRKDNCAK